MSFKVNEVVLYHDRENPIMTTRNTTVSPLDLLYPKTALDKSGEYITGQLSNEGITVIPSEEKLKHAEYPEYVKNEVLRVAQKVNEVKQDDSIVFLAMSDHHYFNGDSKSDDNMQTDISCLHSAMAAKALANVLQFDFMTSLGDAVSGTGATTSDMLHGQVENLFDMLSESHTGVPCFHAIGNHDTGFYLLDNPKDPNSTGLHMESGDYLYNMFTSRSASENTTMGDDTYGGYCYRDFLNKHFRVYLLNTVEGILKERDQGKGMTSTQAQWFANSLLELNEQDDAGEWKIIILSHYPADYLANDMAFSNILKAYATGGNISIESQTFDFSNKNIATIIAQFHGHIHNFLVDEIDNSGIQRICNSNVQYNRENYNTYTQNGIFQQKDEAGNVKTYRKTPNSAKDTSFCINVINPTQKEIHSITYGTGPEIRVISYEGKTYYTTNLIEWNANSSNTISYVEEKESYATQIIPADGYKLLKVIVEMGGIDITAEAYDEETQVVSIEQVTGNVDITARAIPIVDYTNQLFISTDAEENLYYIAGYKENMMLQSDNTEKEIQGCYQTGFIPCNPNDIVYLRNIKYHNYTEDEVSDESKRNNANGQQRIYFYDENKANLRFDNEENTYYNSVYYIQPNSAAGMISGIYDENNNVTEFLLKSSGNLSVTAADRIRYFRLSAHYIGENSIISVNDNPDVPDNSKLEYNLLSTAIDSDGTIFRNKGYQSGYYLSSGNLTLSGMNIIFTSGFIPCSPENLFIFENIKFSENDKSRIALFDANKKHIYQIKFANLSSSINYISPTIDENGYLQSFNITNSNIAYFRFCCPYIGRDSIVKLG